MTSNAIIIMLICIIVSLILIMLGVLFCIVEAMLGFWNKF